MSLSFFFPFEKGLANQKHAQKRRKEEAFLFFLFCLFLFQEKKREGAKKTPHLGEEHHRVDPFGARLPHGPQKARLPAQPRHAGHRVNGDVVVAVVDEDGEEQVGGGQNGLRDGLADGRGAAVAARAGGEVLCRVSGFGVGLKSRKEKKGVRESEEESAREKRRTHLAVESSSLLFLLSQKFSPAARRRACPRERWPVF